MKKKFLILSLVLAMLTSLMFITVFASDGESNTEFKIATKSLSLKDNVCVNFKVSLPDGAEIWSDNSAERMRLYADVLKSGDRGQILLAIRTLVLRRRDLSQKGKKLHITDERALRDAQRFLFDEFSYVLGIDADKVEDYIMTAVAGKK